MVLAGGPDREREVSLVSGEQVEHALRQGGHDVRRRDILPDDLAALDEFEAWSGDVLFLALHGAWGEGGQLQQIIERRGLPFFGCRADAAALCMDKARTKDALLAAGLPTPAYQTLGPGEPLAIPAPLVLKPISEGSSIGVHICRTDEQATRLRERLGVEYGTVMAEAFIVGTEMTCGVIGNPDGSETALPPVKIVPTTEFYDYDAKYLRDDTQYVFDALPAAVLDEVRRVALEAHRVCGCRHLSRVDFMVDAAGRPWVLEINTIPGFTSHSLVPKAAARAGIDFPTLCAQLAHLALRTATRDAAA
jgi:D-alanine-D-alanine ligase